MAGKPKILRELEGLPENAVKEVEQFIAQRKQCRGAKQITGRNGNVLAQKQLSAIKRWAGKNLGAGFAGREHDAVLQNVTTADLQNALHVFRDYSDHLFSFVDCKSFVVMERLGISHAFAFDGHFDEYSGISRVPR